MSLVSDNIKYLRKKSGMTQEQMADQIGIKRSLLGAYEEGRADPRLNNLFNISQLFSVSVDVLISKDVSRLDPSEWNSATSISSSNGSGKVLAITVDKNEKENIELVPMKASAGYLNGYADPEYLEELPKFQLPILPQNGTYRAFEISGDSMLPMPSGTIVIGKYLERPEEVKNGKTYVIVSGKEGVVYKRVFNYIHENGKLFLVSDNKSYQAYDIHVSDLLEIWEAKAFISLQFPDPKDEEELSLQKLAGIVLDLQKEVIKLKGE
jgi:transcriptional regulator with XRE-family HTH domain